jgi:hypothetical protein
MNNGMDHVRDLLNSAADSVGWQIDLDQLPVTCAQVPTEVLTLIEASAAHLAALAGQGMLDEAAESIRTVMAGADTRDIDWEVRLLAAVLNLSDTRRHHPERTRRRLIAALRELEPEGATWPPAATVTNSTDSGEATDLPTALADLGLRPLPASTVPASSAYTVYAAEHGDRKVTVTIHPDDDNTAEVHVFDRGVVAWSATFTPGAPPAAVAAAIRDATPATTTTAGRPETH